MAGAPRAAPGSTKPRRRLRDYPCDPAQQILGAHARKDPGVQAPVPQSPWARGTPSSGLFSSPLSEAGNLEVSGRREATAGTLLSLGSPRGVTFGKSLKKEELPAPPQHTYTHAHTGRKMALELRCLKEQGKKSRDFFQLWGLGLLGARTPCNQGASKVLSKSRTHSPLHWLQEETESYRGEAASSRFSIHSLPACRPQLGSKGVGPSTVQPTERV